MILNSLKDRRREPEWMDEPGVDRKGLDRSLRFIRAVNRLLGYTRTSLRQFKQFSQQWKPGQVVTILDVATGSADIPRAILQWSRRNDLNVRITAIDLHNTTLQTARQGEADPRLRFARADALRLPFEDNAFDYVHCAMFLHHLDEADAIRALSEMNRVAKQGVIATDLLRHRRAYLWAVLFTLWADPMVKHDARVSVRQAFTREEILKLSDASGLNRAAYSRHFGHRFVLAGEGGK